MVMGQFEKNNGSTVGAVYDRPFFLDSTKYGRS